MPETLKTYHIYAGVYIILHHSCGCEGSSGGELEELSVDAGWVGQGVGAHDRTGGGGGGGCMGPVARSSHPCLMGHSTSASDGTGGEAGGCMRLVACPC